jgi:hypothetical protein
MPQEPLVFLSLITEWRPILLPRTYGSYFLIPPFPLCFTLKGCFHSNRKEISHLSSNTSPPRIKFFYGITTPYCQTITQQDHYDVLNISKT